MVIKASASAEIQPLIDALRGPDELMREAAVARLAVIGPRAVSSLSQAYRETEDPAVRTAVLRALEPMGDRRALALAEEALRQGGEVAIAAAAVLSGLLDSPHGEAALDRLVGAALDSEYAQPVRIAAFEALPDSAIRNRIARALDSRPDDSLKAALSRRARSSGRADGAWRDAIDGRLPDDPAALNASAATKAASTPLTVLHRLIAAIRERERGTDSPAARAPWTAVRGALHQALAERGSRIALYDLRDSLGGPDRLPVSFLAALEAIGDTACVEPLAAAFDAASKSDDVWWRDHVAGAFHAIVQREGLTRRHAVIKRVCARWPGAASALFGKTSRRAS